MEISKDAREIDELIFYGRRRVCGLGVDDTHGGVNI